MVFAIQIDILYLFDYLSFFLGLISKELYFGVCGYKI